MRSRLVNFSKHTHVGFTLIEVLISMAIAAMLIVSLMQIINPALDAREVTQAESDGLQNARFAMQQMRKMVSTSNFLHIPKPDNPGTLWDESIRPVLAVSLPHSMDRDKDGWSDANNDKDFQDTNQNGSRDVGEVERIDEDWGGDRFNDGVSGIYGIDDDGDGSIDEDGPNDDDEDNNATNNEDDLDGIDNDGDGSIDEDAKQDMNGDGFSGEKDVDDDGDGSIDENVARDDDEDDLNNEDWIDAVVFYVSGTSLIQRLPNLNPTDGTSFSEFVVAENVTGFTVTRQLGGDAKTELLNVSLTVTLDSGTNKTYTSLIRLGGDL